MEEIASKDLKKTEEEEKKKIVAEVLQVNLFKFVDISPIVVIVNRYFTYRRKKLYKNKRKKN